MAPLAQHVTSYVLCDGHHSGISGRDLVQQVDVGDRILDVAGEVLDLAAAGGACKVVVDPADEDLLGREAHELFQRLTLVQQRGQVRVLVQVDVAEETDLKMRKNC